MRSGEQAGDAATGLRSAERLLTLIVHVARAVEQGADDGVLLKDLAALAGLPKSTSHRLLQLLVDHHVLSRDGDTKRYRLGPTLLWLGTLARRGIRLTTLALPVMRSLARDTGESVTLNVLQGDRRVCIQAVESALELRHVAVPGSSYAPFRGSSGRLLLAFLPEAQRERLLGALPEEMAAHREAYAAELHTIAQRGYALTRSDRLPGMTGIAVPVRDETGQVVASLTVSGPSQRFDQERTERAVRLTQERAAEISALLGWRPDHRPVQPK